MAMQDVIRLKIYVEGLLLPSSAWSSLSVTSRARGSSSAHLKLFPVPGLRIEDWARARVHVTWSNIEIRAKHGEDWPMLFDGEVSSDSFTKSPASRFVGVSMVGPEVYFDQCKMYYFNPESQGGGVFNTNRLALFFGNTGVETAVSAPGLDTVNRIIATIKEDSERPLPSMIRALFKSILSSNYFFEAAKTVLKLDQRFSVPRDDFVSLLYATTDLFFSQMQKGVASREGQTSMSQILAEAMSKFRYSMVCNPQPTLIKGAVKDTENIAGGRSQALGEADALSMKLFGVTYSVYGLTSRTSDKDMELIATRLSNPALRANLFPGSDFSEADIAVLASSASDQSVIDEHVATQKAGIQQALLIIRTILRTADGVPENSKAVGILGGDSNPLDVDQGKPDLLSQFMLLPDTRFATVPRCNVIFPNENSTYGMSRDHLSEPTRLAMYVPTPADNLDDVFFAPDGLGDRAVRRVFVVPSPLTPGSLNIHPPLVIPGGITKVISSRFAVSRDIKKTGTPKKHGGIDLAVPVGTTVHAYAPGVIRTAKVEVGGAGLYVSILHDNGDVTLYMHLSRLIGNEIKPGLRVTAGQVLGFSGGHKDDQPNAGSSTGPHLHFEYRQASGKKGIRVDPEPRIIQAENEMQKAVIETSTTKKTVTAAAAVTEQQSMISDAPTLNESRFSDHRYLTPEEEIRGIVPILDTSMDRTGLVFSIFQGAGDKTPNDVRRDYLRQIALANLESERFATRSFNPLVMPWTPRIVAGFPGLVIDSFRSVIAYVGSVTHEYSTEGQGSATTSVSLESPRYWDEGDPFYWKNGKEAFTTDGNGRKKPDPQNAKFPGFMYTSMFGTNSYATSPDDPNEPLDGSIKNRPEDLFLESMIGCSAIPYSYADRVSPTTDAVVAYNQAISKLVSYYQTLSILSHEVASSFVTKFTERQVALESEFMATFLGATPSVGGYSGNAFRDKIRATVLDYIAKVGAQDAYRG